MARRRAQDLDALIRQAQEDAQSIGFAADAGNADMAGAFAANVAAHLDEIEHARKLDIAWAAGLFEGEGCITPGARANQFRLILISTDRDVVEQFFGVMCVGRVFKIRPRTDAKPHYKQQWRYEANAAGDVLYVLKLLRPFFGQRRGARADEAIEVLSTHVALSTYERQCEGCGRKFRPEFGPMAATMIYCSTECGTAARNRRASTRPSPLAGQIELLP